MRKVFGLFVALVLCTSVFAQKERLELNLTKGEVYPQKSVVNASIVQTIQGMQQTIEMSIIGGMTYKVIDVQNSAYEMEVQYKSLSMKMKMPNGTLEFSSDKKNENDIFSKLMMALVDKPFYIKMTKLGKVTEVRDIDALFTNMFEKLPQLGEPQKEQLKSQLSQAYGEKAIKGNIELSSAIFPESTVSVGEKWLVKTKLESGMPSNVESTYELKECNASFCLISGLSTIATADKEAYIQNNGMPLKYDMTGSITSDIKISKTSGWIMEAKVNQTLNGNAQIKDNPNMPGGMSIPMSINTALVITER